MKNISIIIPCYNCAETLEEAVDSAFTQGLEDFEIVMVDDGSTDSTRALMERLAKEHSEIKLLFHDKNRGGGAARNTGIRASSGEYIFCLDSDNILEPLMLSKMTSFAKAQRCDGVPFEERRFFHGYDHSRYKAHRNIITDRPIIFDDLWNGSNIILDNFVYSKASYDRSGGYPEQHGFDTQAFEIRYLGTGNTVRVCKDSVFYHRQNMKKKSYFERVYEAGGLSRNYYFGLEDVVHLFSNKTIETVIRFDIFGKTSMKSENFKSYLDSLYAADKKSFFSTRKKEYERADGFEAYMRDSSGSEATSDIFRRSVYNYAHGNYEEALRDETTLIAHGFGTPIVYFNLLRSTEGLAGIPRTQIETVTAALIESICLHPQPSVFEHPSVIRRLARRVRSLIP